jgi:hypothetical protein
MRKLFLGAAAAMALATPGVASAANGYVGLDYVNTDTDGGDSEDNVGVSGSAVVTPNIALDAGFIDGDDADSWGAAGHLFMNNSSHLLGAFVGFSDSDDSTTWGGGVEGQLYMNNFTLAGAVGFSTDDDNDTDRWGVDAQARYFISENFRLQGLVGWQNVDAGGAEDDLLRLGVGGEYLFAFAPVSVGLAYTNSQLDEADVDSDAISATVRYNFGGGSLLDRDRSGGGLAGLSGVTSALGL